MYSNELNWLRWLCWAAKSLISLQVLFFYIIFLFILALAIITKFLILDSRKNLQFSFRTRIHNTRKNPNKPLQKMNICGNLFARLNDRFIALIECDWGALIQTARNVWFTASLFSFPLCLWIWNLKRKFPVLSQRTCEISQPVFFS